MKARALHVIAIFITFGVQLLASDVLLKCRQLLNVTTERLDITNKTPDRHTSIKETLYQP